MRHLVEVANRNVSICIAMIVVTGLAIILRFAVKTSRQQRPSADDWICLLANFCFYAYCAVVMEYLFDNPRSRTLSTADLLLPLPERRIFLRTIYELEILFICVITLVKLSMLWFYHRIFALDRINRIVITGTAVACVIWFLIALLTCIFQCNPIHRFLDVSPAGAPPGCFNTPRRILTYEIANLFLDIVILAISVAMVWKLKLDFSRKIGVSGIVLLGAFVCIASMIRLSSIWRPPDVDKRFDVALILLWSTLQLGIAITCACLPTMGPLLSAGVKAFSSFLKWVASVRVCGRSRRRSLGHKLPDTIELQDISEDNSHVPSC